MRSATSLGVCLCAAVVLIAAPAAEPRADDAVRILTADQIAYKLSKSKALGSREQKVDLQSVTFELNSARLTPQARAQLDEVAKALEFPVFRDKPVLVGGHTDTRGSEGHNLELSEARAAAVRDYLVEQHGYDLSRLTTQGYGETKPLPSLPGTADSQRRVEFRLVPPQG